MSEQTTETKEVVEKVVPVEAEEHVEEAPELKSEVLTSNNNDFNIKNLKAS